MNISDEWFPIVRIDLASGLDVRGIADFDAGMTRVFARRERFVVVCDLTGLSRIPDAVVRKRLADVLNRPDFKAQQDRYQLGSANVVASAAVRAAVTALLWVWQPAAPMTFPATTSDAYAWAFEQLRAAGVVVSPLVVEQVRSAGRVASAR